MDINQSWRYQVVRRLDDSSLEARIPLHFSIEATQDNPVRGRNLKAGNGVRDSLCVGFRCLAAFSKPAQAHLS